MLFHLHLSNQKIVENSDPERCLGQGWQAGISNQGRSLGRVCLF